MFSDFIYGVFEFCRDNGCNDLIVQALPMYAVDHEYPEGETNGTVGKFIGRHYFELVDLFKLSKQEFISGCDALVLADKAEEEEEEEK